MLKSLWKASERTGSFVCTCSGGFQGSGGEIRGSVRVGWVFAEEILASKARVGYGGRGGRDAGKQLPAGGMKLRPNGEPGIAQCGESVRKCSQTRRIGCLETATTVVREGEAGADRSNDVKKRKLSARIVSGGGSTGLET